MKGILISDKTGSLARRSPLVRQGAVAAGLEPGAAPRAAGVSVPLTPRPSPLGNMSPVHTLL